MNILVFTTTFYPSIGGVERITNSLINEFLKNGHRVKMINIQSKAIKFSGAQPKEPLIEIYFRPGFFKTLQLFLWCHTMYMPNLSLRGSWFLFLRPFKKWVISHNDYYLSNKRNVKTGLKRFLIKFASENITVSKSVGTYLNTKSKVIYNCYDNEIFKIYDDEKREYDFVFLGRLVSQKGCDFLIKACNSLEKAFTLNIIGDGPERQKLERMVEDLNLNENIKFWGILEGENLGRMLNRHKVMVIPPVQEEGFGMVALEGMACGCKIIAAEAGGLNEALNGFGKTFKMGSLEELEHLLKNQLAETKQPDNYPSEPGIYKYLAAQRKEEVALKYLYLFQ